jgi:hypothetical protein
VDREASVVLLDGGQLTDVREALAELALPFRTELAAGSEAPKLLLTSVDEAQRIHQDRALHVVVGGSPHSVACDFLLTQPVSVELLRLLVARAHYGGPERRRATRSAIGAPITLDIAGERREAVLAQVSAGGCGLVSTSPLEPDRELTLEVPAELTGPHRTLRIRGSVLGSRELVTGDGTTFDVSVRFEELTLPDRITLRALMSSRGFEMRPETHASPGASAPPRRGADGTAADPDKRVVIGRAVSRTAMQLERDPCLAVGDLCKIALYDGGGGDPVHVRGRITEEAEDRGFLLRFEEVSDAVGQQLDRVAASVRCAGSRAGFVIAEVEA